MLLKEPAIRTLLCPGCSAVMFEHLEACGGCGRQLSRSEAAQAAEERGQYLGAYGSAHTLAQIARGSAAVALAGVAHSGLTSRSGSLLPGYWLLWLLVTLLPVPVEAVRWWWRFGDLQHRDPEFPKLRRWLREALVIWALSVAGLLVWWTVLRPSP